MIAIRLPPCHAEMRDHSISAGQLEDAHCCRQTKRPETLIRTTTNWTNGEGASSYSVHRPDSPERSVPAFVRDRARAEPGA